ncbi:hypothetical protein EYF80_014965 [Liparis tanakae]|uniref:Uncharacterized protein n=1 Tax=Liparis tanakae TaxID=230148 RepID=A0A4Z2IBP0_9TELE|nr:hypothetical protein EYF80_014965 [Liparis tanakae]
MALTEAGEDARGLRAELFSLAQSERNAFRTAGLTACGSGFRSPTMHGVYLGQSTLAKKGKMPVATRPTCSRRDLASFETDSGMLSAVWRPIPAGWHPSKD